MDFIKSITIERDFVPFTENTRFDFKQINCIVGDQGCGKSTLIELIMNNVGWPSEEQMVKIRSLIYGRLGETNKSERYQNYLNILKELPCKELINLSSLTNSYIEAKTNLEKYNALLVQEPINVTYSTKKQMALKIIAGVDGTIEEIMKNPDPRICRVESSDRVMENYIFHNPEKHNPRGMVDFSQTMEADLPILRNFLEFLNNNDYNPAELEKLYAHQRTFSKSALTRNKAIVNEMDVLTSRMKSHGQALLPLLKQLNECKNGLIFVDEPETAMSIKSQYLIADVLKGCVNRGCQIFVATHSPIIMKAMGIVLSLEHKGWMSAEDFIETQTPQI